MVLFIIISVALIIAVVFFVNRKKTAAIQIHQGILAVDGLVILILAHMVMGTMTAAVSMAEDMAVMEAEVADIDKP